MWRSSVGGPRRRDEARGGTRGNAAASGEGDRRGTRSHVDPARDARAWLRGRDERSRNRVEHFRHIAGAHHLGGHLPQRFQMQAGFVRQPSRRPLTRVKPVLDSMAVEPRAQCGRRPIRGLVRAIGLSGEFPGRHFFRSHTHGPEHPRPSPHNSAAISLPPSAVRGLAAAASLDHLIHPELEPREAGFQ